MNSRGAEPWKGNFFRTVPRRRGGGRGKPQRSAPASAARAMALHRTSARGVDVPTLQRCHRDHGVHNPAGLQVQTRCTPLGHQTHPPRVPHPQGTRAANTSAAPRHHRPPQATQRCRVQCGANVTDARHRPHSAWPPARAGGQRAFTTLRSPDRALSGAESRSQPPDRAASAGAVQGSAAWGPPPGPRCPRMRTPDKGGRSLAAQPRPPAPLPATDTPHRRRSTSPSLVTRTSVAATAARHPPPASRAAAAARSARPHPPPPVPGGPGRGPRQGGR